MPDEPEQAIERPQRDDDRRRPARQPEYEIGDEDLPQRRLSRGGPWGPAMREKLTRIAQDKGGW